MVTVGVLLSVVVYAVMVSMALALLCLPGLRQRVVAAMTASAGKARAAFGRTLRGIRRNDAKAGVRKAAPTTGHHMSPLASTLGDAAGWLRAHRWVAGCGLTLLLLGPTMALLLRHWHGYDGFDHTYQPQDNLQIAELLRGEQLVPPPRLPPELFMTHEVEQAHPLAASASRQWQLLDAEFSQRLLRAFKQMREQHGYEMVLIEGFRSGERQTQLASLGANVTHAPAGRSYHQYGLAADCAFLVNGRVVISERDPVAARGYALYGEVAKSMGLVWGGGWRTLVDLGHVELPRAGVLAPRAAAPVPAPAAGSESVREQRQ